MAAQEDDEAGAPLELDAPAGPEPLSPAERLFRLRLAGALAVVLTLLAGAVLAIAVPSGSAAPTALDVSRTTAAASPPATSLRPTATPTPTSTAPPAKTTTAPATPTVPAAQLAAEKADLQKTAARLTAPLRLASPASWDRWLPAGKPYPGASTAEDIATCPTIASRLAAALGQKMSYWIGTLPGEGGCVWAPVPLTNDDAASYPYVFTISYVGGATTQDWRHHFYEHQGAICPDLDVPAVGPGAVLVRCENTGLSYALVLRDSRRPDGVWLISADTRPNASRPATLAFTALVQAAKVAYG